jgi:hypothetical protein
VIELDLFEKYKWLSKENADDADNADFGGFYLSDNLQNKQITKIIYPRIENRRSQNPRYLC